MKYFINGDKVNQSTYDRELDDNYNCGITMVFTEDEQGNTYMTYDEGEY